MAGNYLPYNIGVGSTMEPDARGIADDFAQGGTQHSRTFHSRQYFFWTLVHFLSQVEFDALAADYDANPRTTRTFVWPPEDDTSPETTYTVKYLARPLQVQKRGVDLWVVTVRLRGYKD